MVKRGTCLVLTRATLFNSITPKLIFLSFSPLIKKVTLSPVLQLPVAAPSPKSNIDIKLLVVSLLQVKLSPSNG